MFYMRDFGAAITSDRRVEIVSLARQVFDGAKAYREVRASAFVIDLPADPVVVREAEVKWRDGRLRVAMTEEAARPPFEWLMEITSNVGEADYFKHYLIRDDDIVLAQRKVLTPIDEEEAAVVLADLAAAKAALG